MRGRGVQVTEGGGGLEAHEPAEYGEGGQVVGGGQVEDLGAGAVACRRESGAGEGLQEHAVEGERQQAGVTQVAGQPLRLPGRVAGAVLLGRGEVGAAALDRHGGEEAGGQVGGGVGAEHGERTFGGLDDRPGLRGVVGPAPQGGHVVRADDPGGEGEVAGAFGRRDRGEAVAAGADEGVAARQGEGAGQVDGGARAERDAGAGPGGGRGVGGRGGTGEEVRLQAREVGARVES